MVRSRFDAFFGCARGGFFGLATALSACSGMQHNCYETRDCPSPIGFIEAGGNDNWWDPSGAAGESELSALAPAASAGQPGSNAAAAGEGGSSGATADVTNEPPRVVGVSPTDGAPGVASDSKLVIRFSQPMNADSVEAAYQSNDLPPAGVSFEWNEPFTSLTITPAAPLRYATGSARPDGTPAFEAEAYQYGFSAGATDRAGRGLSNVSFAFSTLRQVSSALGADAALTGNWTNSEGEGIHDCTRAAKAPYVPTVCVGDDPSNGRYTGFLSFDLGVLPAGIVAFSRATLEASGRIFGTPESLGESRLEHVSFTLLGAPQLSTPALALLGPFYARPPATDDTHLVLSSDLTRALADDYAKRSARSNRSQYRLSFAKVAADADWDDVEMPTSTVRLAATYLLP